MVDIRGPEGKGKVETELNRILGSNPKGFAGLSIKKVSISGDLSVSITMISLKRQGEALLAERAKFFRELMGNKILAKKISVVFTGNSFE